MGNMVRWCLNKYSACLNTNTSLSMRNRFHGSFVKKDTETILLSLDKKVTSEAVNRTLCCSILYRGWVHGDPQAFCQGLKHSAV